jgi:hypothetical protein
MCYWRLSENPISGGYELIMMDFIHNLIDWCYFSFASCVVMNVFYKIYLLGMKLWALTRYQVTRSLLATVCNHQALSLSQIDISLKIRGPVVTEERPRRLKKYHFIRNIFSIYRAFEHLATSHNKTATSVLTTGQWNWKRLIAKQYLVKQRKA